jgi:phospholipase C
MNNGNMDGFVMDAIIHGLNETNPVSMFDSTTAPIINLLAKEFAVFDSWFSSVPSATDPNR